MKAGADSKAQFREGKFQNRGLFWLMALSFHPVGENWEIAIGFNMDKTRKKAEMRKDVFLFPVWIE